MNPRKPVSQVSPDDKCFAFHMPRNRWIPPRLTIRRGDAGNDEEILRV